MFQARQTLPDLSWDITLLIDASASMRGMKWRIVEGTVASLHRALSGSRGRFQVYAYFETDGICMISSLVKDGRFHSAVPAGRTASGQAIIAAGLLMPDTRRRKLLVHITDGESNLGCPVGYGIGFCRSRGIPLVTLGCGYRDREAMQAQYGGAIDFLDSFRRGRTPNTPHAHVLSGRVAPARGGVPCSGLVYNRAMKNSSGGR